MSMPMALIVRARGPRSAGLAVLLGAACSFIVGGWVVELDFSPDTLPRLWNIGELTAIVTGSAVLWFCRQRLAVWEIALPRGRMVSAAVCLVVLATTCVVGLFAGPGIHDSSPGARFWIPAVNAVIVVSVAAAVTALFGANIGIGAGGAFYASVIALQSMDVRAGQCLPLAQFAPPTALDFLPWIALALLFSLLAVALFYRSTRLVTREVDA